MIWVSVLVASALVAPIDIERAVFVSAVTTPNGTEFKKTTRIPYKPRASCYQWALQVRPQQRSARIREVFELPAAASHWGKSRDENIHVGSNRSSAITALTVSLADGVIAHGWCVAAGDPLGHYKISVFENHRLLHRFEFDVYDEVR